MEGNNHNTGAAEHASTPLRLQHLHPQILFLCHSAELLEIESLGHDGTPGKYADRRPCSAWEPASIISGKDNTMNALSRWCTLIHPHAHTYTILCAFNVRYIYFHRHDTVSCDVYVCASRSLSKQDWGRGGPPSPHRWHRKRGCSSPARPVSTRAGRYGAWLADTGAHSPWCGAVLGRSSQHK